MSQAVTTNKAGLPCKLLSSRLCRSCIN